MKKRGYLLALVLGTCSLAFLSSLILARVVTADRLFVVRTQNRLKTDLRALEQIQYQLEEQVQKGTIDSEAGYVEFDGQSEIDGTRSIITAAVGAGENVRTDDYSLLALDLEFDGSELSLSVEALGQLLIENLGSSESSVLFGSEDWRNHTFTSDVLLTQGTFVGFWVRARRGPEGITGYLASYSLLEHPLQGGTFRIDKVEGNNVERLGEKQGFELGIGGLAWLLGVVHRVEVGAEQERIWLRVDGRDVLEVQDPEPLRGGKTGYKTGIASLMLVNQTAVDNVIEIRSLCRKR